jgi:ATP-dependent DNA ligase
MLDRLHFTEHVGAVLFGTGLTAWRTRRRTWGSLRWVTPRQVVEVEFVEWTDDGLLRHSRFVEVARR